MKIKENKMIVYKITPKTIHKNQRNRYFFESIHAIFSIFDSARSRFNKSEKTLREKDRIYFDVVFDHTGKEPSISFYVIVSETFAAKTKDLLEDKFGVIVDRSDFAPLRMNEETSTAAELIYKNNHIFSQKINYSEQTTPISTIVSTIDELKEGDKARLSIGLENMNAKKWKARSDYAHKLIKEKKDVPNNVLGFSDIAKTSIRGASVIIIEIVKIVTDIVHAFENVLMSGYKQKNDQMLLETSNFSAYASSDTANFVSNKTHDKRHAKTFRSVIRACVDSHDDTRKEIILHSLGNSFLEIEENNAFKSIPLNQKSIGEMNSFKLNFRSKFHPQRPIISTDEAGKMIQYPTKEIQEKYKNTLQVNKTVTTHVKAVMLKSGLEMGEVETKDGNKKVYFPTKSYDELCLPHVVIGAMGSGKTEGFGGVHIVEMVRNGFGAIGIDPKDYQIRKEIEAGLDKSKITYIDFAKTPFSLDWSESKHAVDGKTKVANAILSFFESMIEDGTGAQTSRYIRAAVMAMQTDKLKEVIKILEEKDYTRKVAENLRNEIHRNTLIDLCNMTEGKKAQILAPIYNRLDILLGDDYLYSCMDSVESIDFVELMSRSQAIIIDIPKSIFDKTQIQIISSLITTKIDLASTLRKKENRIPFSIVYDEPHQMIKSAKTWKSAVVESRYWRLKYVFMFHSWEHIPRDVAEIIKAAGAHYTLYPSSKETFKGLKEEISPITIEEAMTLKKWHAINVVRCDGEIQTPFILSMAKPFSKR